jgi:hypothetical protein
MLPQLTTKEPLGPNDHLLIMKIKILRPIHPFIVLQGKDKIFWLLKNYQKIWEKQEMIIRHEGTIEELQQVINEMS